MKYKISFTAFMMLCCPKPPVKTYCLVIDASPHSVIATTWIFYYWWSVTECSFTLYSIWPNKSHNQE